MATPKPNRRRAPREEVDTSDIPEQSEEFFRNARIVSPADRLHRLERIASGVEGLDAQQVAGIYVFGAAALAGLYLLGYMAGNRWGIGLAIVAATLSWIAQNMNASRLYGVGGAFAILAAVAGAISGVISMGWMSPPTF